MGISSKQFEAMQSRVSGRRPRSEARPTALATFTEGVLLGIDPSLRGTGFALLELRKEGVRSRDHGTIRCPAVWTQTRCLAAIAETIRKLIKKHSPTICIVEGLFFAQNIQTALIMGQARGASLAMAAAAGLPVFEMAPRRVKQAIVGYGGAQKDAVAKMVQRMLNLADQPDPDAADALALALAFVQTQSGHSLAQPKRI